VAVRNRNSDASKRSVLGVPLRQFTYRARNFSLSVSIIFHRTSTIGRRVEYVRDASRTKASLVPGFTACKNVAPGPSAPLHQASSLLKQESAVLLIPRSTQETHRRADGS